MKIIVCKIKQQNKLETDESEIIHSKNGSSYVKHKVDIYKLGHCNYFQLKHTFTQKGCRYAAFQAGF